MANCTQLSTTSETLSYVGYRLVIDLDINILLQISTINKMGKIEQKTKIFSKSLGNFGSQSGPGCRRLGQSWHWLLVFHVVDNFLCLLHSQPCNPRCSPPEHHIKEKSEGTSRQT